jgi:tetratricopeptide (TPR) repeat protein
VWVGITVLTGLAASLIAGFRARRVEAFAALWFAASMIAVSNLLFLISTNFGERLLYVPSVIVCYLAARALFRVARLGEEQTLSSVLRWPVVTAPVLIVLSIASVLVVRRTREWRDQITLFAADVQKYPNSARLNNYLGNLLYFEGDKLITQHSYLDLATADLNNAKAHLLRGLAILDEFQDMHAVLGMAEYQLKQYREAIPHLERSLAFKDFRTTALEMMADCYAQLQTPAQALRLFKQIDAEGIKHPPAWFELGNDAAARGDDDASIRYFERFIAARPDNVAAQFNLASAHHRKGDYAQSLASAERCIVLQPTPAIEASCLILAADDLRQTGHRDQALAYFERARAIDPNNPWIRKPGALVK